MKYYYNDVPGKGLVRNNLIYTSLVNDDYTEFVQWYHNDTEYHKGKNQVVDPSLMEEKWNREKKFLSMMAEEYPQHVPYVININDETKKVHLKIDGVDFWQQANCDVANYDSVLPNWQEQMLEILEAHRDMGIYKYSLHPSSYFVVDGKLKSINYFFCYTDDDEPVTIGEHLSHISDDRQNDLFQKMKYYDLTVDDKIDFRIAQQLCFDSFSNNYPQDFINKARKIYV